MFPAPVEPEKQVSSPSSPQQLLTWRPQPWLRSACCFPPAPTTKTKKVKGKEKAKVTEKAFSLTEIKGIGQKTAKILTAAGYDTPEKIKVLTAEDLVKLGGIGEKTADKILKAVKNI